MSDPILIDSVVDFKDDQDGLVIKRQQVIPQSFIDDLRREKEDSITTPAGEMYRVASIPVAIIDKWHREGFDFNRAPIRDVLRRLANENLDHFITTKKRI